MYLLIPKLWYKDEFWESGIGSFHKEQTLMQVFWSELISPGRQVYRRAERTCF